MKVVKLSKSKILFGFQMLLLLALCLIFWSFGAEASIKFTVWATYYIPVQQSDVREVSLPDVFIKWAHLSPGSFDNEKWYPGPDPDRKHTEGDWTWNWNTLAMPDEEKPNPPDIDFFNYKETIKNFYQSKKFEVRIKWRDKMVIAPVNISWDGLGPWNYQDNYWEDSNDSDPTKRRRLHSSLKRGMPAAQAAIEQDYLGGFDETYQREPKSMAGIDFSKTLAEELGFLEKERDLVEVEFLWLDEEPPLTPTAWSVHQFDIVNSGCNPNAKTLTNAMMSSEMAIEGTYAYSQPVVDENGIVYIAAKNGVVYATNPQEKYCLWDFNTGAELITSPVIEKDKIYVLSLNGKLYCLNRFNKEQCWVYDLTIEYTQFAGKPHTSPQIYKDYVCFTFNYMPFFVNKHTGVKINLQYAIPTFRCTIYSTPAIQNDVMYIHDCRSQVIAYSVPNGFYLWHQANHPGSLDSAGAKAVVLIGNKLILRVMGYVYAVNTESEKHKILWQQIISGGYSAPVVKDNKIYIQGYYGGVTKIYCLDPGTGDVLESPIEIKDDVEISIGGNNLYVACLYLQEITAIDLDLFKIRWTQQNIPGYVYSPVVPVGDKIYLSVLEHQLTAGQQITSTDNMLIISLSGSDIPEPVVFSSFSATVSEGQVVLEWTTQSETNNLRFDVYKNGEKIGSVRGAGDSALALNYKFIDDDVKIGQTYEYSIEDIDFSGQKNRSEVLTITIISSTANSYKQPEEFKLLQNYPNPFNPETWIPFELSQDIAATINIYDAADNLVKCLGLGNKQAGFYKTKDKAAYWDGRNYLGEKAASGVYFYTLQAGKFKATRKMLLVK